MKYLLLSILSICLLGSCNLVLTSDNIKSFIPGTYVGDINTEFSKGKDTLVISKFDEKSTYSIIRKTMFRRSIDGKLLPVEYKSEKWTAIYDEDKKILNEIAKGKTFSFNPDRNLLLLGSAEYSKIE